MPRWPPGLIMASSTDSSAEENLPGPGRGEPSSTICLVVVADAGSTVPGARDAAQWLLSELAGRGWSATWAWQDPAASDWLHLVLAQAPLQELALRAPTAPSGCDSYDARWLGALARPVGRAQASGYRLHALVLERDWALPPLEWLARLRFEILIELAGATRQSAGRRHRPSANGRLELLRHGIWRATVTEQLGQGGLLRSLGWQSLVRLTRARDPQRGQTSLASIDLAGLAGSSARKRLERDLNRLAAAERAGGVAIEPLTVAVRRRQPVRRGDAARSILQRGAA